VEAKRLGIPTVIIDSGLQSDQIASFVATDNLGALLAGEEMGRLLGGKGKALLLRYQGSASTEERSAASSEDEVGLARRQVILGPVRGATATPRSARREPAQPLRQRHQGIFIGRTATTGMLLALQESEGGQGGDSSASVQPAVPRCHEAGQLDGIVLRTR
jgi:ribose transport system substrate-binding protein